MYHIVWIQRYRYEVLVKGVVEYLMVKLDEIRKQNTGRGLSLMRWSLFYLIGLGRCDD